MAARGSGAPVSLPSPKRPSVRCGRRSDRQRSDDVPGGPPADGSPVSGRSAPACSRRATRAAARLSLAAARANRSPGAGRWAGGPQGAAETRPGRSRVPASSRLQPAHVGTRSRRAVPCWSRAPVRLSVYSGPSRTSEVKRTSAPRAFAPAPQAALEGATGPPSSTERVYAHSLLGHTMRAPSRLLYFCRRYGDAHCGHASGSGRSHAAKVQSG